MDRTTACGLVHIAEQCTLDVEATPIDPVELYQNEHFFTKTTINIPLPTTSNRAHVALSTHGKYLGVIKDGVASVYHLDMPDRVLFTSEKVNAAAKAKGIFWCAYYQVFVIATEDKTFLWCGKVGIKEMPRFLWGMETVGAGAGYIKFLDCTLSDQTLFSPCTDSYATVCVNKDTQKSEVCTDELTFCNSTKVVCQAKNNAVITDYIKWNKNRWDSKYLRVSDCKEEEDVCGQTVYDVDYGGSYVVFARARSIVEQDTFAQGPVTRITHKLWEKNSPFQCVAFLYTSKKMLLLQVREKKEALPAGAEAACSVMAYNLATQKLSHLHTQPTTTFAVDPINASFLAGNTLYKPNRAVLKRITQSSQYANDVAAVLYPKKE